MIKINFTWRMVILLTVAAMSLLIAPLIGERLMSWPELLRSDQARLILLSLRLPRVIFAFIVGFSLAIVGAVFQALLRNDLATPYTLGVSSGGALGAVVAIKLGAEFLVFGFPSTAVFSVIGSLCTIFLIYTIARGKYGLSTLTLVLAGVTVSLFFSSLILFVHYLADFTETYRMIRWLMGGLQVTGWRYILVLLPFMLVISYILWREALALNILSTGTDMALSKGVRVGALQKKLFISSSVLIGVLVALAGPIGFIGLIIPHLVRLLTGADHRRLLPVAAITGGIFLVWCDTLARTMIAPAELPVGVITAMLGGPFFIWLLLRHGKH